jgi:hypothetical protein
MFRGFNDGIDGVQLIYKEIKKIMKPKEQIWIDRTTVASR